MRIPAKSNISESDLYAAASAARETMNLCCNVVPPFALLELGKGIETLPAGAVLMIGATLAAAYLKIKEEAGE